MTDASWRDQLAGERLQLDQDFRDRVREAGFSTQEWNLVMTAVEFDVEHAEDPDAARLVADTSRLPAVLPELDRLPNLAAGAPAASGVDAASRDDGGSSGIFGRIKGMLGVGDGGADAEREQAAERLASAYASQLQERLESGGRWEAVRSHAAVEKRQ